MRLFVRRCLNRRPAEEPTDAGICDVAASTCQRLKSELNEEVKREIRRQPFPVWCVSGKVVLTPPHNLFITGFFAGFWEGFWLRVGVKNDALFVPMMGEKKAKTGNEEQANEITSTAVGLQQSCAFIIFERLPKYNSKNQFRPSLCISHCHI